MHWNRSVVNPIWGALGKALLVMVALFSYSPNTGAAPSSSFPSIDLSFIGQPGMQTSLLPTPDPEQLELDHKLFLPVTTNHFPRIELEIYDWAGNPQSWGWLLERFGAVWLHRGSGAASARILLEEASGQTALIVRVDRGGLPVQDVPVMFYWPDAPWLVPELRACNLDRALVIHTNADGEAHFSMGGGSAYWPPGGGPHIVWVGGPGSDCLGGLGWLGGTNHIHLNSEWELP